MDDASIKRVLEALFREAPDAVLLNHPSTTDSQKKALIEKADYNAQRNITAHSGHCKASPRVGDKHVRECNLNLEAIRKVALS